jgi:putative tricarboxylic transport membrane protein
MTWSESVLFGLGTVFSWPGILIPTAGTMIAMTTAFLPGIGTAGLATLLILLTAGWSPESALLLFGALTGGATFMGSVTAILFNVPGGAQNSATLLDGYPLAQRGYPRTAITCAAAASAVGSLIGVLILIALLPLALPIILALGPLEMVLIGAIGLVAIATLPSGSRSRGLAMAACGLLVGLIGADPGSGVVRWSFGNLELSQGISTLPVMIGVFSVAEMIQWLGSSQFSKSTLHAAARSDSTWLGLTSILRHWSLVLKSSVIGTVVGIIPGIGGTAASFIAYSNAARSAEASGKHRFGRGDIRGLIAPEAAVDAKDGGSLLPAIVLGLPGSEAGVVLLAAFAVHGLVPGRSMLTDDLPLTFVLIFALVFSNLITSLLGVALTPWLARLGNIRLEKIALPAIVISLVLVYQIRGQMFDVYTVLFFAVFGHFLRVFGWPRVPFVIAFILSGFIETNLVLATQLIQLGRIVPHERVVAVILAGIALYVIFRILRNSGQPNPCPPVKTRSDTVFALIMVSVALLAVIVAVTASPRYSIYSLVIAGTATCFVIVVALMALAGDMTDGPMHKSWSSGALFPVASMAPFTFLLGLPAAIGVFAFIWMTSVRATTQTIRWHQLFAWFAVSITAMLVVNFYLTVLSGARLRPGFLFAAWPFG